MKTAIILFNLGGPDSLNAVRPFLFNLFFDPAIIRAPTPVRWCLAQLISRRRAPTAQEIYAKMGGKSPILEQTLAQAQALEKALGNNARVFTVMRYWHPRARDVVQQVKTYEPERVVLLPLYPQYSTTTTASSLAEWYDEAARVGLKAETKEICCYPTASGFIEAQVELLKSALTQVSGPMRVLFSAHGLPERVVEAGDPYPKQVEQGVAAVIKALGMQELDAVVCYQSRVGPLKWIGPSTDDEIRRAGSEKIAVVLVPIAFVSEHSETLVELDMEYRHLAEESGVTAYARVPTVQTHPLFVRALAALVQQGCVAPCGLRGCRYSA